MSRSIVRGNLTVSLGHDTISRGGNGSCPALLDACGRTALLLQPGPNDVSQLSPGVYFVTVSGRAPARVVVLH